MLMRLLMSLTKVVINFMYYIKVKKFLYQHILIKARYFC